jgi:hypothetical protein
MAYTCYWVTGVLLQAQCQIAKIAQKKHFPLYFISLDFQTNTIITTDALGLRFITSHNEFKWCKAAPMHSKISFYAFTQTHHLKTL